MLVHLLHFYNKKKNVTNGPILIINTVLIEKILRTEPDVGKM